MDEFDVEDYVDRWMLQADSHLDDDQSWFASIPQLSGMWGAGDSRAMALADLRQALNAWVHMSLSEETELPQPVVV